MLRKIIATFLLISFSIFSFGCATNPGNLNSTYPSHASSYPTSNESWRTGLILAGVGVVAVLAAIALGAQNYHGNAWGKINVG